ncbi:xanthine dehydrogenase family protein molybdopterin-binding subunit [Rhodoplanes sp. TEM]|uniref:Xanthine dehydrogenase family protein molybdopterin-binding subunit n=1 Tax=Rhodoplanes tepidamans TaxID=200616 RepID=A0ABT5J500_RHOTP|nr:MULTISPECIES: xanthine dehydrogenase family protein molybdopterin-binding subunit [Rhodoplanes]MDC7784719.1 xanthine dehydrogenase family protein molybdopterin-binding subunit [Rhodoplanes tepidamans]MDC7982186.1 xanthine dehydrogenase family protein molybdopterin-binding subunit [Rhodoplanes sp. TEM]MDQ0356190.1 carbon-monoxide dehydrogenase large subunit [Rhodoplanes tepidamans]
MSATGVGASVARTEDDRFLRGRGQYVADWRVPGTREVAFVRSPVAHARLRAVRAPEDCAGTVFTAADLRGVKPVRAITSIKGFKLSSEPILATGKLRFVGEVVAACVAATRAEAEDLAERVELDYEELPAVTDMLAARRPDAPLVHEEWGDNVFIETVEDRGMTEAVLAAPLKITREIRTARQCMFPMEGRGALAFRDDRLRCLTLVSATQMPHIVQLGVADCLGLPDSAVRVISPDVGGGFGYKGLLCREEVVLGWLAQTLGHPVRWLEDCREHLGANANCREHHYVVTGFADRDGRLLGIDCVAHVDAGAYSVYPTSAALEASMVASLIPGPYDFRAYRCRSAAVATNKCPILPYRGVGRTGVCLAIEAVMDGIAREIGVEPYEVRLRNLVRPEQMPYDNVMGRHFDGGDYPEAVRRAVAAIGVEAIRARQTRGESDGRLIGVGLAVFCEQGAHGTTVLASWGRPVVPGYEQAIARLTVDGDLEIRVGTHSHGQGHETTFAQVAHEVLGVPFARIRVMQGDTLYTPFSTATWGSRSMVMGGGAVAEACRILGERIKAIGAWLMQADPADATVGDGCVRTASASVSFAEVARAWYLQPQHLPPDVDTGGLEVTAGYRAKRDSGTFSYAAHAVCVAVDPETGLVEILDYVVLEDGGVLVNPMIVDGQVRGGTVQGIGTGLFEAVSFDAQGQPLASTLVDYLLPGAGDVPEIRVLHMETPSPNTTFGAKGIGEGGAIGPPAALVSAVNDALRPLGVELQGVPLGPERILAAVAAARASTSA